MPARRGCVVTQFQISCDYYFFESCEEVDTDLQLLMGEAREAVNLAYAPYSHFYVGAAVLLSNGKVVKGSNQENASFPAGICAERVALSVASSLYPLDKVVALAVAYRSHVAGGNDNILSPCGICRQSLLETSDRQQSPIKLLLSNQAGKIILLENSDYLLPLAFSSKSL
jgi:cytidine deaminase